MLKCFVQVLNVLVQISPASFQKVAGSRERTHDWIVPVRLVEKHLCVTVTPSGPMRSDVCGVKLCIGAERSGNSREGLGEGVRKVGIDECRSTVRYEFSAC